MNDIVGKRFGKLKVLQKVNKRGKWGKYFYRCLCDCGKRVTVGRERLLHKAKPKVHCGCENKGLPTLHPIEYHAWWDAEQRCNNPNHHGYSRYGGKGVSFAEVWKGDFAAFLKYIGKRPKGYSLDRIDPRGNYEPGNVRWASDKTQARNKRDTKYVKHPKTGKPVRAADLADEEGIRYQSLRARMIEEGTW